MNTFYYFEGTVYETLEQVEFAAKNYKNKQYDEIKTTKSFNEFDDAFYNAKKDGDSDLDAIEWAK